MLNFLNQAVSHKDILTNYVKDFVNKGGVSIPQKTTNIHLWGSGISLNKEILAENLRMVTGPIKKQD